MPPPVYTLTRLSLSVSRLVSYPETGTARPVRTLRERARQRETLPRRPSPRTPYSASARGPLCVCTAVNHETTRVIQATGAKAKAWCLLIHAEAPLSPSLYLTGGMVNAWRLLIHDDASISLALSLSLSFSLSLVSRSFSQVITPSLNSGRVWYRKYAISPRSTKLNSPILGIPPTDSPKVRPGRHP